MQIEDVTLLKCLGKGSFGEVYLSTKKGRNQYFATKKWIGSKQISLVLENILRMK